MLLSLNWLKQYIDLPKNISAKKLAEDLTMCTVEVESVVEQSEQFNNIVVGKVVELSKHPNADKLKIAFVDIGLQKIRKHEFAKVTADKQKQLLKIICGGTNLRKGMFVAVALLGAKVRRHGQGETVVLKEAEIRGEKSFGMICSSNEIGLEKIFPGGEMEIIDLSNLKNIKPGQEIAQVLGLNDTIIEIENKSLTNRPDLWSHYGIARELAVIYQLKLKPPKLFNKVVPDFDLGPVPDNDLGSQTNLKLNIKISDKKLCYRYIGCVVNNIKIEKSPDWLVRRLESVGIKSINNVVDITNYVMLDVGQPMHAFNLANVSRIKSRKCITNIVIRPAKKGEKIKTLDNEIRNLDESVLVIADSEKPVAIAGIIGGLYSGVDENTTDIVFEAATFDAISVRKTSQKLNLRTEASNRFEKNLDPNLAKIGMLRTLELIKQIIPKAEISELVDVDYSDKDKRNIIKVEHKFLEKRIGQKIDSEQIINILKRLGFSIKSDPRFSRERNQKNMYLITVPCWRLTGDISIPEDIVEEVARIYSYDNLKEKIETVELKRPKYQLEYELENKIKNYLSIGCGMNEVFNYPWSEQKILNQLRILKKNMIEIDNPPSEENRYLQTSLIPNLIKNIEDNLRYFDEFRIFELSRVYKNIETQNLASYNGDDKLPYQPKLLAGAVVASKDKDAFLEVKGIIEEIVKSSALSKAERLNCYIACSKSFDFANDKPSFINSDKSLNVLIDKEKIGWLGELNKQVYNQFNFKNKNIGLFEINFDKLCNFVKTQHFASLQKKYQPLPQYPSIKRDLAIEVDWNVKWNDVKESVLFLLKLEQDEYFKLIQNICFLSEYDLGDKKSLAFRLVYQTDRTLKDEEVEVVENKIINILEKKFMAKLRQ